MPKVRQAAVAQDFGGLPSRPFVDVQTTHRRPAKKRKLKGSKSTKTGSNARVAGGVDGLNPNDPDSEMRWGAELVLQLAMGGDDVPPAAPKFAHPQRRLPSPLGFDNKGKRKTPEKGASSAPLCLPSLPRQVLVGDPVVVHRGAVSDGAVHGAIAHLSPPCSALPGQTTTKSLGKTTGKTCSNATTKQTADAVKSTANDLPPLRLSARSALPKDNTPAGTIRLPSSLPSSLETNTLHPNALPRGDGNSLCDLLLEARNDESNQITLDANVSGALLSSHQQGSYPNLVDQFTKAFRTLQTTAAALVRAHAENSQGEGLQAISQGDQLPGSALLQNAPPLAAATRWTAATANAMSILESQASKAAAAALDGSQRTLTAAELDLIGLVGLVGRAVRVETNDQGPGAANAPQLPPTPHAAAGAVPSFPATRLLSSLAPNAITQVLHTGSEAVTGVGMGATAVTTGITTTTAQTHPPKPPSRQKLAAMKNSTSPASPFKRGRSSSTFRGVTLHRRTKRWESHIWVRETGKQLYLGGFDLETAAAEAHDLCALKIKGYVSFLSRKILLALYCVVRVPLWRFLV